MDTFKELENYTDIEVNSFDIIFGDWLQISEGFIDNLEQKGFQDVVNWIEKNRMLKGNPFSFLNADFSNKFFGKYDKPLVKAPRPYLMQFLSDSCVDKTVIKCRQSEFSENEINTNLFLCCTKKYINVMHVFPTYVLAETMSKLKIHPAIKESSKIYERVGKTFAARTIGFDNGSFYQISGSSGDISGRAVSIDSKTFDEYESQRSDVEEIFEQSSSHSKLQRTVRISTPLLEGGGIDAKFKEGCQYEWEIKCPKCHTRQIMTFPDNLINYFELDFMKVNTKAYYEKLKEVYIGCKYCKEYIDRTSDFYIETSKWVAQNPDMESIKNSYRVTAFMLCWKTGQEIMYKYHNVRYIHQFYNEVLGIAYTSPDAKISESIFEDAVIKISNAYISYGYLRNVSIGVDWGPYDSYVVVMADGIPPYPDLCNIIYVEKINKESLIKHGFLGESYEHQERVEQIANFMKAGVLINDANGIGYDKNSYLIKKFPNRAFGCFYDTYEIERFKRKTKIIEPQWQENKVTVSRVGTIKNLLLKFIKREIGIPQIDENVKEFIQHCCNVSVVKQYDEKSGQEYEIAAHTGHDHYCLSGETLILTNKGEIPIKDIKEDDYVLTRKGFKKVLWSGQTGIKETKEYNINGNKIRATKNHKIWTRKGFKKISLLTRKDIYYILSLEERIICEIMYQLKLSIKVSHLDGIQMRKKEVIEFIMCQILQISKKVLDDYIKKYGKINLEKFQEDFAYIIKTIIQTIIRLKIWNVPLLMNIEEIIKKNIVKTIEKKLCHILMKLGHYQKNGIKQKKEKSFIKSLLIISEKLNIKKIVSSVIKNMKRRLKIVNSVEKIVYQKIEEIAGLIMKKEYAKHAGKYLQSINIENRNFAVQNALIEPVYNLTIDEKHEYFANGILVSNCHATNYARIGYDYITHNQYEGDKPGIIF